LAATGVAVLVAGCSSIQPKTSTEAEGKEPFVTCSKCQTVWVQRAHHLDKSTVEYRREKQLACPDCRSAVAAFFKTGKLAHTCKSCGGQLDHGTGHEEAMAAAATKAPEVAVEQEKSVMCGKCRAVWVRRARDTAKTTVYRREKARQCPDCKSAAANFFATGKWQQTCAKCGESLSECMAGK
jgi:ribosomal protein L37AE/L43A